MGPHDLIDSWRFIGQVRRALLTVGNNTVYAAGAYSWRNVIPRWFQLCYDSVSRIRMACLNLTVWSVWSSLLQFRIIHKKQTFPFVSFPCLSNSEVDLNLWKTRATGASQTPTPTLWTTVHRLSGGSRVRLHEHHAPHTLRVHAARRHVPAQFLQIPNQTGCLQWADVCGYQNYKDHTVYNLWR